MRFLLWTATIWVLMFLGVVALDVGYTAYTGTQASSAVTKHIDFSPAGSSLHGWMGRAGRALDRMGAEAFGRYVALFEMGLYGVAAPLLIAMPLAWEARRRRWTRSGAIVLLGLSGLAIGAWLAWKYPDLAAVFHALVNVTRLSSQAAGLSYFAGSLFYFVIVPLLVAVGYGGVVAWRSHRDAPPAGPKAQEAQLSVADTLFDRRQWADWRLWNVRVVGTGLFVGGLLTALAVAALATVFEAPLTYTYWAGEGVASTPYRANNILGHLQNLSLGALSLGIGFVSLSLFTGIVRPSDAVRTRTPGRLGVFVQLTGSYLLVSVASLGTFLFRLLHLEHTGQHWVGLVGKSQIADATHMGIVLLFLYGAFLLVGSVFVVLFAALSTYMADPKVQLAETSPGLLSSAGHCILYGLIWGAILLASVALIYSVLTGDFLTPAVLVWSLYGLFCLRAMEAQRARGALPDPPPDPTE
jgi:hypothetical protein